MLAIWIAAVLSSGAAMPVDTGAVARPPTDGQILGIVGELNADEIEAAKLAEKKGSGGAVNDYAKMIVDDHQNSEHELLELVKRLHITPQIPADSTARHTHATVMTQLNLATGAAFDKAFVQYSLADHEAVLDELQKTLLPAAHNARVRQYLRRTLSVMQHHEAVAQAWVKSHQ